MCRRCVVGENPNQGSNYINFSHLYPFVTIASFPRRGYQIRTEVKPGSNPFRRCPRPLKPVVWDQFYIGGHLGGPYGVIVIAILTEVVHSIFKRHALYLVLIHSEAYLAERHRWIIPARWVLLAFQNEVHWPGELVHQCPSWIIWILVIVAETSHESTLWIAVIGG
jgi:hypothetical protein